MRAPEASAKRWTTTADGQCMARPQRMVRPRRSIENRPSTLLGTLSLPKGKSKIANPPRSHSVVARSLGGYSGATGAWVLVPNLPEQFIQQVQQATDIVDLVIGQYVALKKRGKDFVGLCPFHEDHHPSMNVSPAKQIFKCFACGAGGGVFQFVMRSTEAHLPRGRAAAGRAGGHPRAAGRSGRQGGQVAVGRTDLVRADGLRGASSSASSFWPPAGRAALEYAHKRRLTDESIERFGLGFAPDGWDGLLRRPRHGGLPRARSWWPPGWWSGAESGGGYDRFRNRLMFPIFDADRQGHRLRRPGAGRRRAGQVPQQPRDGPVRQVGQPVRAELVARGPSSTPGRPSWSKVPGRRHARSRRAWTTWWPRWARP